MYISYIIYRKLYIYNILRDKPIHTEFNRCFLKLNILYKHNNNVRIVIIYMNRFNKT